MSPAVLPDSHFKTKYSNAGFPLDPALAEVLLNWHRRTLFKNPEDCVFASALVAGKKPRYPWGVERCHGILAGIRCGIGRIGWHLFRHYADLMTIPGEPWIKSLRSLNEGVRVHMPMVHPA